jgi:hypothetical protein
MTESCFAIRGNSAPAGRCAALPKQQLTRNKQEKESMNKIVSVDGDTTFYGVIADLGLDFVHSPVHRIVFDIDEAGIQLLAERYAARVPDAASQFPGKIDLALIGAAF